jgi:hypothetical protein
VFAVGTGEGRILFYDLVKNKSKPSFAVEAANKTALQAIAFNPKSRFTFASGDAKGVIKIWQLNSYLSARQKDEEKVFEEL